MKKVVPENCSLIPEQAEKVFKGQIFDVYQWQQEMFDGSFETFEMLKRVDTLKIFAVVDSKLVVLYEEQPKFGTFTDVPGGRNDYPKETQLEAAQREMLEETGMTLSTWKLIDIEQPMNKVEWFSYTYLASDLVAQVDPVLDAGEKINVELMAYEQYRQLGEEGKLRWWPAILKDITSIEELLALPEYIGKEIER